MFFLILFNSVEDPLTGGIPGVVDDFVNHLRMYYIFGAVVSLPKSIKYFRIAIEQDLDYHIRFNADKEIPLLSHT